MPQLGLGLGLHKSSYVQTPYQPLIASSNFYMSPDKADGEPWTKLEPRTLPNGVSNGEYLQNVSVDVVITSAMLTAAINRTNYTQIELIYSALP